MNSGKFMYDMTLHVLISYGTLVANRALWQKAEACERMS
jgi:hypothetical protein